MMTIITLLPDRIRLELQVFLLKQLVLNSLSGPPELASGPLKGVSGTICKASIGRVKFALVRRPDDC